MKKMNAEYLELMDKYNEVCDQLRAHKGAVKELTEENKRLNQIIGKYAGKMSDIATFNDEVSKQIRKVSSEMIMS